MKLAALLGLTLAGCNACQPTPAPAPPPVLDAGAAPSADDLRVYGELAEAGCLLGSGDGVQSVAAEHALHDPSDGWLDCLYDGGSVQSCKAPCE